MRQLAAELGPRGITVNAVAPGAVRTDALAHFGDAHELAEEQRRRSPLGRLVTPDDVGRLVAFLCSDLADLITGQVITIDAGFSVTA